MSQWGGSVCQDQNKARRSKRRSEDGIHHHVSGYLSSFWQSQMVLSHIRGSGCRLLVVCLVYGGLDTGEASKVLFEKIVFPRKA